MNTHITLTQLGLRRSFNAHNVLRVCEIKRDDAVVVSVEYYHSVHNQSHSYDVEETYEQVMAELDLVLNRDRDSNLICD